LVLHLTFKDFKVHKVT
jgi:hypothetical protein